MSASKVQQLLARFRQHLVAEVRAVNALTASEVAEAGRAAAAVVVRAARYIEGTRAMVAGIHSSGDRSEESITGAVEAQSNAIDAFARDLESRARAQRELARVAAAQVERIGAAARAVERLSQTAKFLAINARIEGSRLGKAAGGIAAIANEMHRLSEEVNSTNAEIAPLAEQLGALLPQIEREAGGAVDAATTFAEDARRRLDAVQTKGSELGELVARIVREGEAAIAEITDASQAAMSHLQFQDVAAQRLLALDDGARRAEVGALKALRAPALALRAAPAAQSLLGSQLDEDEPRTEALPLQPVTGQVLIF